MKEKDIVTDILGRVEAAVRDFVTKPEFAAMLEELSRSGGGFESRIADQLAQQIKGVDEPVRRHWGRSEAYVPARRPDVEDAKARAVAEASRSGRVAEAAERHGVSRATIYRAMSASRLKRP